MLFIRCLSEKYENLIDNAETSSLLPKYSMQTVPIRLFEPFPSKCEKSSICQESVYMAPPLPKMSNNSVIYTLVCITSNSPCVNKTIHIWYVQNRKSIENQSFWSDSKKWVRISKRIGLVPWYKRIKRIKRADIVQKEQLIMI